MVKDALSVTLLAVLFRYVARELITPQCVAVQPDDGPIGNNSSPGAASPPRAESGGTGVDFRPANLPPKTAGRNALIKHTPSTT